MTALDLQIQTQLIKCSANYKKNHWENKDLASTNTSALTAWRRELAYAEADLSNFNFQRRVSFGIILVIPWKILCGKKKKKGCK